MHAEPRTFFVCRADEEPAVRARIRGALNGSTQWRVLSDRARPVHDEEGPIASSIHRRSRATGMRV